MFNFKKKLIKELRTVINSLEEELHYEREKNRLYQKDLIVLLENAESQRGKIKKLENNIEFLYENLPVEKKKLIRPEAN